MAKKQSLEKKKMIRAQSLQKKEDRAKEEAALLNRCLGLLGVLVAAEIYFLLCYRFFIQGTMQTLVTMSNVIAVVGWVGLAVAAVGLVFALVRRGQKGAQWGAWLVILGLVLSVLMAPETRGKHYSDVCSRAAGGAGGICVLPLSA